MDDRTLGYYIATQAYHYDSNRLKLPIVENIMFGEYNVEGGGTFGEMSMTWYKFQDHKPWAARLQVFDDAWDVFRRIQEIHGLSSFMFRYYGDTSPTPGDFVKYLDAEGFTDLTQYVHPEGHPEMPWGTVRQLESALRDVFNGKVSGFDDIQILRKQVPDHVYQQAIHMVLKEEK
jgi:hypothetical protein